MREKKDINFAIYAIIRKIKTAPVRQHQSGNITPKSDSSNKYIVSSSGQPCKWSVQILHNPRAVIFILKKRKEDDHVGRTN